MRLYMRVIVGLTVIGLPHNAGHEKKVGIIVNGEAFRLCAPVAGIGIGIGSLVIVSSKGIEGGTSCTGGQLHIIHDTARRKRPVPEGPSAAVDIRQRILIILPIGSIRLAIGLSLFEEIGAY